MKNYLKRTTTFILALLMLLSVPLQAFAEVNYDNLAGDKAEIINKEKLPLKPAKPEEGKTAADLKKIPTSQRFIPYAQTIRCKEEKSMRLTTNLILPV